MDLSRKAIAPNGAQLLLERACISILKGNILPLMIFQGGS